jgi:hypothetical protein
MKGKLKFTDSGWYVSKQIGSAWEELIPVHPKQIELIAEERYIDDVEFEVVDVSTDSGSTRFAYIQ